MNFLCCCCRKSILKKEDNSSFVKYNDVNNILKIKRTISNLSENSESKISDFSSSDTISDCSNSSLNDYIIALDSIITRQEYQNHRPPVCTHIIENLIFNQNLL